MFDSIFFFYSSNFNSIELIFNIFKIWMRRYWRKFRIQFQNDFVDFLKYEMNFNDCDIFAKTHFKYSNKNYDNYRFENDYCYEHVLKKILFYQRNFLWKLTWFRIWRSQFIFDIRFSVHICFLNVTNMFWEKSYFINEIFYEN